MPTKEHSSFSLSFFSFSSSPFREAAAPRNSMATSLQRVVIHRNRENPGSVVSWGFSTPAGRTHELPTPLVNRFITDRLDFSALVKCTGFRARRSALAHRGKPASQPSTAGRGLKENSCHETTVGTGTISCTISSTKGRGVKGGRGISRNS